MHKARFIGRRVVKRYGNRLSGHFNGYPYAGEPYSYWKPINPDIWGDRDLIYEGELDEPIFTKGQMVYLHTIQKSAEIENVFRSTDGTYTYQTEYVLEEIEDNETRRSKEHAEMYYELSKDERLPRSECKKESWWKRIFG